MVCACCKVTGVVVAIQNQHCCHTTIHDAPNSEPPHPRAKHIYGVNVPKSLVTISKLVTAPNIHYPPSQNRAYCGTHPPAQQMLLLPPAAVLLLTPTAAGTQPGKPGQTPGVTTQTEAVTAAVMAALMAAMTAATDVRVWYA